MKQYDMMLIPQEKLGAIKAILENDKFSVPTLTNKDSRQDEENTLTNAPWKNLLEDDE